MHPTTRLLPLVALAALAPAPASLAALILDETFETARTTSNLPATSAWYSSRSSSSVSYENSSLTLNTGSNSTHLLTCFTDSGSVTLGVGETLTVAFTFSIAGVTDSAGGLRVAILNSGGSRISADGLGAGNATFNAYTGYAALLNPGATVDGPVSIRKRDKTNEVLLTGLTAYTNFGSGGSADAVIASGQTYTGTFIITRSSDTATGISFSIAGTSLNYSYTDSSGLFSFDTLAIAGMSNAFTSLTLYDVTISTSTIPEPRAILLGFGVTAGLATLLWRRPQR
ncbi:hypothetical protein OPIT5_10960 [Opitutaceae bacterium TAV5]|nr:hypothetical protein OPIT5_10960 [Opitutaceae bacterium TAV5]